MGLPPEEPLLNCNAPIGWSQLDAILAFRISAAFEALAVVGKDMAHTEALRGEIRALKSLRDLPNEAARRMSAPPASEY